MKLTPRFREKFVKQVGQIQGRAVGFRTDKIRLPDGRLAQREYLTHPGAVGVLAFDPKGRIILIRQYRYPVAEFTYELPAGKLSKGENPLHCVVRELEEEAGVRAKKVTRLVSYWPTAAFSDEVIHLFMATDLYDTQVNPDEDEFLEIVRFSPKKVDQMIRSGKIRDSKTLIAFLAWRSRQRS